MLLDIDSQKIEYDKKSKTLSDEFEEVSGFDFYRDIFPLESFERAGHEEDRKPNAIIVDIGEKKSVNHIVFDDLSAFNEIKGVKFAITNCIAYSGRNRTKKNAYSLYGFIIDLDYVTDHTLGDLIFQMEGGVIPMSTYLVNSGTGIHVYYVFNAPIPLYDWLTEPLNKLKIALTDIVWNQYTSTEKKKQFQSIYQGFRVVGSQSKLGIDYPVKAYKTGKKVSIEYLNKFVSIENKLKFNEINRLNLAEARKQYPEWYEKRVIRGEKRGFFHYNRGMYDKWLENVRDGTFDGNRYHCICVLFANAIKCDVSKEEAIKDAIELLPILESKTKYPQNHFTMNDILDASVYYNEDSHLITANTIRLKTQINLPVSKRNGRKQTLHLKLARANRDILQADKGIENWYDNSPHSGRKPKKEVVSEWRKNNPNGKKIDCSRDTGLHINTVYKWWNS